MEKDIDVLGRDAIIDDLMTIIQRVSKNERGCCFAIDGKWGVGKTFILEKLERELNPIQNENTCDDSYFFIRYNCWKYDYYEEPLIAIVTAIYESLNAGRFEKSAKTAINTFRKETVKIVSSLIKNKYGIDVQEIIEDYKEEKDKMDNRMEYDSLFAFSNALKSIRKHIGDLAQKKTMIIAVDELDRCLPEYAIKALERIHHVFDGIPNVVVILALDGMQLEQSVKEIYGENVDVDSYLRKFVLFKYKIEEGNKQQNLYDKYSEYFELFSSNQLEDELMRFINTTGLDIRSIERCIDKCKLVHKIICDKEKVSDVVLLFEMITAFTMDMCSSAKDNNVSLLYRNDMSWVFDGNISVKKVLPVNMIEYIESVMLNIPDEITINMAYGQSMVSSQEMCAVYFNHIFGDKNKYRINPTKAKARAEEKLCKQFIELYSKIN